jgi:hypothetical protein
MKPMIAFSGYAIDINVNIIKTNGAFGATRHFRDKILKQIYIFVG